MGGAIILLKLDYFNQQAQKTPLYQNASCEVLRLPTASVSELFGLEGKRDLLAQYIPFVYTSLSIMARHG